MARSHRVEVIRALRATIDRLEQDTEIPSDDADLAALKSILLRRIGDLEREDELAAAIPEALPEALPETS